MAEMWQRRTWMNIFRGSIIILFETIAVYSKEGGLYNGSSIMYEVTIRPKIKVKLTLQTEPHLRVCKP